jgi:D-glycero-alpha-D-manno-heptose-7-phosphate kinase
MIIVRSPLRISLGGGGTDLPSYYRNHGGFVIAAAINRYVYIALHETFVDYLIVKYSEMEKVGTVEELKHPLVREALKLTKTVGAGLEIASMSDIPAGSGLGSSGSFTTALLSALHILKHESISTRALAEMACNIEIDILGEPIGKQDQFIASYGGVTCFDFERNDNVVVSPLRVDSMTLHNLEDNLVLFFTRYTRNASEILKDQDTRSRQGDLSMIENLHVVKQIGYESKAALEEGNLRGFAELMHTHWEHKKKRTTGMSNGPIDQYYELARNNGALGGKLIGAGGGGFLMFYAEDKMRLRNALYGAGLREVHFRFDFQGSSVIAHS